MFLVTPRNSSHISSQLAYTPTPFGHRCLRRWDVCRLRSVPPVLLAAPLSLHRIALAQAGTASVLGDVKDQQGATLPGATVTLTSLDTGAVRTTVTTQSGTYRFVAIPPGLYSVKVELTGFRTA